MSKSMMLLSILERGRSVGISNSSSHCQKRPSADTKPTSATKPSTNQEEEDRALAQAIADSEKEARESRRRQQTVKSIDYKACVQQVNHSNTLTKVSLGQLVLGLQSFT